MKRFQKLAVTSSTFSRHKILVEETKNLCEEIYLNDDGKVWTEESLVQWLSGIKPDALILGIDPLTHAVLQSVPSLRAIGKFGVGVDNVDFAALERHGVFFGWQGGVNKRSVAELALGFMLGHLRNIFRSVDRMQRSEWNKQGGQELSGKTIGIVGLGQIGTELARLLSAFGCKVIYHDIADKTENAKAVGATHVVLERLLSDSDIISLHIPGGSETKYFIGRPQLSRMKPSALLVNTSRGSVVDFDAATTAVREKQIAAYASDVFPTEPLTSDEFRIEDGFYFTPHIGGNSSEAVLAMGRAAIHSLKNFMTRIDP